MSKYWRSFALRSLVLAPLEGMASVFICGHQMSLSVVLLATSTRSDEARACRRSMSVERGAVNRDVRPNSCTRCQNSLPRTLHTHARTRTPTRTHPTMNFLNSMRSSLPLLSLSMLGRTRKKHTSYFPSKIHPSLTHSLTHSPTHPLTHSRFKHSFRLSLGRSVPVVRVEVLPI